MTVKRNRYIREYHPLDLTIRRALAAGMEDGVLMTIEHVYGFEIFGAYENWRGGYRVSGRGQVHEAQYLEDAINGWAKKVNDAKEHKP